MAGLLAPDPAQQADPWAGVAATLAQNVPPPPPPAPVDPQASIAAMLATPQDQLRAYAKTHAATSALRLLGATLSDVGAGIGGRQGTAVNDQMTALQGLASQPLQLAQQKAKIAGLMQAYATASPEMRSLILSDPEKAMAAIAKNQELVKGAPGEVLMNADGAATGQVQPLPHFSQGASGVLNDNTGALTPTAQSVTAAPGVTVHSFNPATGLYDGPPAAGGAPAQPQAAPAPAGGSAALAGMLGSNGSLDPASFYKNFILPHEGGLNPADMNGSPTMYGFNQKANMDVNVKRLTPESATARYVAKYWPQTGGENLPPALAAINADTSFINPAKAAQFLKQSGGDPAQYMALRRQWMASMVQRDPRAAKYAKAWDNRNRDLSNVAGIGGAAPVQAANPGAPAPPVSAGAPTIQGKTAETLSPQEAQAMGLAPGRWQRDPTGALKQVSETPAGDLKRLDSLTSTADMLRGLVNEQTQFLKHNQSAATGAPLADINVLGHEFDNPITGLMARGNPDMQAMEASHARQTFMVKPPASGRVMQSEIPYWAAQAQAPGNEGPVNVGILRDNAQRLATVTAEAKFYQDYLYQHGNSQGFESAWAKTNQVPARQASAVPAHPNAPHPGQIEDGYRFLGGDPANPKSWVKQ